MTASTAAEMVKDMIRDCLEDAEQQGEDRDEFTGIMLIEGACSDFRDVTPPLDGTSAFLFHQDGYQYLVAVHASRAPKGGRK